VRELGLYPGCLRVLDVLAEHSDESGKPAGHPEYGLKVATIAREAMLSPRHTHRCIRQLECAGLVVVERRPGEGVTSRPSLYHLAFRAWSRAAVLVAEWRQRIDRRREDQHYRNLARGLTAGSRGPP